MTALAGMLFWMMVAVAAFHAAYASGKTGFLMVLYLFALLQLAGADRWRKAFYSGLTVGLLIAVVRLQFFWRIFSGGAIALWLVCALWIGLFVALARVRVGAEALVVPTMDTADWGSAQHELHARMAPARPTEYGLPIFRIASSGISQLVDRAGRVRATAPCPGDGAALAGTLQMCGAGGRPPDRWLAPFAVSVTAVVLVWLSIWRWFSARRPADGKAQSA